MLWLIRFLVEHRNVTSLFLTVILSLMMLRAEAPRQQQIARALTLTIFYPFQFTAKQFTRARNIYAENKRLRNDLTEAMTSLSLLSEQINENSRLRALLSFADNSNYELISARVIAREPSQLYRSLVIDAGRTRGVKLYMPVVTEDGVVGKVMQVLPHISLIQLLRDPSARTSTMLKNNRSVGILETETGREFFIRHRTHVEVGQGDTVITSGLGGIYPKGLSIGTVTEITEDHDPLFKRTLCAPNADFAHLEEVFVLKLTPQWTSLREELDSLEFEK